MTGSAPAVLFAVVGGVAVAVQVGVNAALGRRIGVLETVALTTFGSTLILAPIVLAARRGIGGFAELLRTPAWMWLGGAIGTLALCALVY